MATATYIPIATQTLGSASSSITFSSIPNTYTDLRLVVSNAITSAGDNLAIQINGDTGANYSLTNLRGQGTTAISGNATSTNRVYFDSSSSLSTTVPQAYFIDIFSYAGSTNKTVLGAAAADMNGSGSVELTVGLWRSTAAITSITVKTDGGVNTFNTGTIFTLWGI